MKRFLNWPKITIKIEPKKDFKKLSQWLALNDLIEFKETEFGTGVFALTSVKKQEFAIKIMESKFLLSNRKSNVLTELLSKVPAIASQPSILLALVLLEQDSDPMSEWRPYLNALPVKFNLPFYWTLEKMDDLKGSCTLLEALKMMYLTMTAFVFISKGIAVGGTLILVNEGFQV